MVKASQVSGKPEDVKKILKALSIEERKLPLKKKRDLTEDDIDYIAQKVAKGKDLRGILVKEFPSAMVYVLKEEDYFTNNLFVYEADFKHTKSIDSLLNSGPRGHSWTTDSYGITTKWTVRYPSNYHLLSGTIEEMENDKLNSFDRTEAYSKLYENLKNREGGKK